VNGFQLHNEPGNEQNEVVQQSAWCYQEYLCDTGNLKLYEER
jgi:hypothetical protein